ncbi:MAG: hypothetical protein QXP98_05885 [Thermoproteus sp.]
MLGQKVQVKKLAKSLLMLVVMLYGMYVQAASTAPAQYPGHIIQVALSGEGELQYNITSIQQLLSKLNATAPHNATSAGACSCAGGCNRSAPPPNVKVYIDVVANETWTEDGQRYQFLFANITASNGTLSYTEYLLFYGSQGPKYNFTAVTQILTKPRAPDEYALFITRIDSSPARGNATAVEYIVIKNATTLSDSYRIIAKALMKVKGDSPKAWQIAHVELNKLANIVKEEIPKYDKKAPTIAVATDVVVCVFSPQPLAGISIYLDCLQPNAPMFVLLGNCCVPIAGAIAGCAAMCLTGPESCLLCAVGAINGVWNLLSNQCYPVCPAMNVCVGICALSTYCIPIACIRIW